MKEHNTTMQAIGWIFLGLFMAIIFGLFYGVLVMVLWNWLMTKFFGLQHIGYFEAAGMYMLAHLLLKAHSPVETRDRTRHYMSHTTIGGRIKTMLDNTSGESEDS